MRIQDHLGKITWTMLDKGLFMVYGLIRLYQVSLMDPSEFGLFALLDAIIIAISTLSDSFALNGIVKYGSRMEERAKFNALSLISHLGISLVLCGIIYVSRFELASVFNEQGIIAIAEYVPLLMLLTLPRLFFIKFLLRETKMREVFIANGTWFFTMIGLTLFYGLQFGDLTLDQMVVISCTGTALGSLIGGLLSYSSIEFAKPNAHTMKEFFTFGAYQVAWNIPATIMRHLDLYIIQFFFGTTIVGIFQSAKTLYRFFEALIDGISGLYYPALVRMHARGDKTAEHAMTSKIISFTMFGMTLIVFVLSLGIGEWLVNTFLSSKYMMAYQHFSLLMLCAIMLPMMISAIVYITRDHMKALLGNAIISSIVGISVSIGIGMSGHSELVALGTMSYVFTFSLIGIIYTIKQHIFELKDFFRAIPDSLHFVRSLMHRQS
ncbi:MAG: lipopolysaccharide biosynthesis protein [Candidatus Kapaibacteriota bacterium]